MGLRAPDPSTRPSRLKRHGALAAAAVLVGTSLALSASVAPATAAPAPTDVYLGGLGLSTKACPVTPTNVVYVPPGTTLRFHADLTGLGAATGQALVGLNTTMTNPLNAKQNLTVTTAANGYQDIGFGGGGTFGFTWNATTGVVSVLGQNVPVPLIGALTGARLNWAGQVVVSSQARGCTLAPQLPGVGVSPSLPVIGTLPGVNVPGTQLPGVTIPGLPSLPGLPGSGGSTSPTPPGSSPTPSNPYGWTDPGCTGPCLVVPRGGGSGGTVGNAYGVTVGQLSGSGGSGSGSAGSRTAASGTAAQQLAAGGAAANDPAGAFDQQAGGSTALGAPLPTALTLLAIIALAGTTILYARRRLQHR